MKQMTMALAGNPNSGKSSIFNMLTGAHQHVGNYPGVTVEITEGSWSGWDTTFSGFFAAGEGPDIINLGSEMNTLYGESLADMDPYLGGEAWPDIANFGPALENAKYEGKLRGLPIFTAPRYVFCRTDLMEEAGWSTGTPHVPSPCT